MMVGGADKVTDDDGEFGVVPLPEKVVQLTVMGTELMFPAKVIFVPDLRAAVTVTPGPNVANAAVALTRTAAMPTPTVVRSIFLCLVIVVSSSLLMD